MRRSAAGWRFPSLRGGGWGKRETTNRPPGHERILEQVQVYRAYKHYAQCPWVLQRCQGEKCANLWSARSHFDAIISMKIVDSSHVQFKVVDIHNESYINNCMCKQDFTALRSSSSYFFFYFFCYRTKNL